LLLVEQLYGSRGHVFNSFKVEHRVMLLFSSFIRRITTHGKSYLVQGNSNARLIRPAALKIQDVDVARM
jgi:hypothetical protein